MIAISARGASAHHARPGSVRAREIRTSIEVAGIAPRVGFTRLDPPRRMPIACSWSRIFHELRRRRTFFSRRSVTRRYPRRRREAEAVMRWVGIALILMLAGESQCGHVSAPAGGTRAWRAGDDVRLRGALDEDVDCRLLRADNGQTYSLSARLARWRNGERVCIHGTLTQTSGCLHGPTIE